MYSTLVSIRNRLLEDFRKIMKVEVTKPIGFEHLTFLKEFLFQMNIRWVGDTDRWTDRTPDKQTDRDGHNQKRTIAKIQQTVRK